MNKIGWVVDTFEPLLKVHVDLIDQAFSQFDEVRIIIIEKTTDKISGQTRYNWLRETYPTSEILLLTDSELIDLSSKFKKGETVFSTDKKILNEIVNPDLEAVLCKEFKVLDNCNKVTEKPIKYWKEFALEARSHFVKKVVLYGAESSGKTTLSKQLARHYNTVWNPEFSRGYLEAKYRNSFLYKQGDPVVGQEDKVPIALGQMATEDEMLEKANKVVFYDTNIVMTKVYYDYYLKDKCEWLEQELQQRKYDLYLLLTPDIPWEADEMRDSPEVRQEIFGWFVKELEQRGISYVEISGENAAERFRLAQEAVEQHIFKVF
ncbi:AAA family ATPase [Limibacter armeniacum]|uniref:AAA family ATPase n=1 Tax=Limibacter armeniacum TaxID=466084 RepID=UPI002FE54120